MLARPTLTGARLRVAAGVLVASTTVAIAQDPSTSRRAAAALAKLPLHFVENGTRYDEQVKFFIHGADKSLFFTEHGITFALRNADRGWNVKLDFIDANEGVVPIGGGRRRGVVSYFERRAPAAGLATFSTVTYPELWPGIDLVYDAGVRRLKYRFVVRPGADPRRIRMRYRGASLHVTDERALRIETPAGSFEDGAPVAYQWIDGKRVEVDMAYDVRDDAGRFGFRLGAYDPAYALVLDPVIFLYAGLIGGSSWETATSIAIDSLGDAYVTGSTVSSEATFPVTVGPDTTHNGQTDVFVAKINGAGTALVYCGFLGGPGSEEAYAIAVDPQGNAYVTGVTGPSFPVTVGPDLTYNGMGDAFVAKIHHSGTSVVYCGYIGGDNVEYGHGIAVDAAGYVYIAGRTQSDNRTFPVKRGPGLTRSGIFDGFVARLHPSGTVFDYCGYTGDAAFDVAVDASGHAYVVGETGAGPAAFSVKVGPSLTYSGAGDVYVAKVNPTGTGYVYRGYIGGRGLERAWGVAVDNRGCAYVVGETQSGSTFPVKIGPDLTYDGLTDGFIAKVSSTGASLDYCGFIGGNRSDEANDVAVDAAGAAYVVGWTLSSETTFPSMGGPLERMNGAGDGFIVKVSPSGAGFDYAGYVGGPATDQALGVAVTPQGRAFVCGNEGGAPTGFPVLVGPSRTSAGGGGETFVAKISTEFRLTGASTVRLGGTMFLTIDVPDDPLLPYLMGASLAPGPTALGNRRIGLTYDPLLDAVLHNRLPSIFVQFVGLLDFVGKANPEIRVPRTPGLVGVRVYTAFVTLGPLYPLGIRSISNTVSFTIDP